MVERDAERGSRDGDSWSEEGSRTHKKREKQRKKVKLNMLHI